MHRSRQILLAIVPIALLAACEQSQPTELAPRSLALSKAPSGPVSADDVGVCDRSVESSRHRVRS